mmetsp:Transcript_76646/g.171461  ORF Transcript_76646/g.171461 Transcript_76646/m.171461 type:complete len:247 (+) Transcript_76646:145-885(+)
MRSTSQFDHVGDEHVRVVGRVHVPRVDGLHLDLLGRPYLPHVHARLRLIHVVLAVDCEDRHVDDFHVPLHVRPDRVHVLRLHERHLVAQVGALLYRHLARGHGPHDADKQRHRVETAEPPQQVQVRGGLEALGELLEGARLARDRSAGGEAVDLEDAAAEPRRDGHRWSGAPTVAEEDKLAVLAVGVAVDLLDQAVDVAVPGRATLALDAVGVGVVHDHDVLQAGLLGRVHHVLHLLAALGGVQAA